MSRIHWVPRVEIRVRLVSGLLRSVMFVVYVYYESRKRELKIRLMNEGRCDERL
jgi:hypothetical protein